MESQRHASSLMWWVHGSKAKPWVDSVGTVGGQDARAHDGDDREKNLMQPTTHHTEER